MGRRRRQLASGDLSLVHRGAVRGIPSHRLLSRIDGIEQRPEFLLRPHVVGPIVLDATRDEGELSARAAGRRCPNTRRRHRRFARHLVFKRKPICPMAWPGKSISSRLPSPQ